MESYYLCEKRKSGDSTTNESSSSFEDHHGPNVNILKRKIGNKTQEEKAFFKKHIKVQKKTEVIEF